jgi:hypothetical protein|tara:strand:+ start:142 stop:369 length:228 start_codon:yes stop_codon:yes gene_type:complete
MREEINWREELLESANFNGKQERILREGPRSLVDSWILGALYSRWKKLSGYREPPVPNCQSSFQEFNKKVREVEE